MSETEQPVPGHLAEALNIIAAEAVRHFGDRTPDGNRFLPLSVRYDFAEDLIRALAAAGWMVRRDPQ